MRSDRLKQVMQQIDSNFDERNAGFNRFSKFVTEAGNRGLLSVTRLENGQFEVAPIAGAGKTAAKPQAKSAAKPSGEAGTRDGAREERPSRRRGRRGGRGREREESGSEARTGAKAADKTPARAEGALTLAAAFRLMTDALADLGGPTGNEQLRSRMVAMLGREDELLDEARFPRLLRQANDAEVADVRKIGEGDEYEVTLSRSSAAQVAHRGRTAPSTEEATAIESAPAANGAAAPASEPAAAARLSGVRFRRGSRAPSRPSSLPLVGVVSMETDTPGAAEAAAGEGEADKTDRADKADKADKAAKADRAGKGAKTVRSRARKSSKAKSVAKPAAEAAAEPAAKPAAKRTRTRARKKAAE